MTEYVTKDSGERATFDSGMQRDTESGKPRFDLMVAEGVSYDEQMLTRFAKLLGRGAEKYEDRNWEKADSEAEMARMRSSAFRHFMQWLCGEEDEDHAAATIFNILAHETTKTKVDESGVESELAEVASQLVEPYGPPPTPPAPFVKMDVDGVREALPEDWEDLGYTSQEGVEFVHPDDKVKIYRGSMPSETAKKLGIDQIELQDQINGALNRSQQAAVHGIVFHNVSDVDQMAKAREINDLLATQRLRQRRSGY